MRKKSFVYKSGRLIVLLIFLGIGYYFFRINKIVAATITEPGEFRLTAENKWNGKDKINYVSLAWDKLDDLSQAGYQLHQFNELTNSWTKQSLNYEKTIKVLNVYPNNAEAKTLKKWMDSLNLKDKSGNNLIQVTEVRIEDYNKNSADLIKNSAGDYLYDVIMFGSWDDNFGQDISNSGYNELKKFSDYGRGVLFGHDTIYEKPNFQKFASQLGIVKDTRDRRFGGPRVQVVDNGYLLKYPFELKNNAVLSIPATHSGYKVDTTVANVWMRFTPPFTIWPNKRYNSGNYTNEWYLITNKNLAMIQTGHSNGASTSDEQKIIANTLYNLAQVSLDTTADDYTVKDDKAPKLAEIKQKKSEDATNISVEVTSEDQGKEYQWRIEGNTKNSKEKKSDTVKETIVSNIAGYKYVIDNSKESTLKKQTENLKDEYGRIDYSKYDILVAPTGITDKQDPSYDPKKDANQTDYDTTGIISNINAFKDFNKYLHVVSVDRSNNVSEVKTVPIKDILTQFYVIEKYKDIDENQLIEDSISTVQRGERYSQSPKPISGYQAEGYLVEGSSKVSNSGENPAVIDTVQQNYTITYYYKKKIQLNLRQVVLSNREGVVVPNSGYMNLIQKDSSRQLNEMNIEIPSGVDEKHTPFSKLSFLKEKGAIQLMIDTTIPQYYKYVSHISTTTNSLHESQKRLGEQAKITLNTTDRTFWITIYIEPTVQSATSPSPYSWDYKKNELGTIVKN